tara:strand:+ start:884 stop:997 length:114 start_codon:yes stop_codon:yes gene_type:complete
MNEEGILCIQHMLCTEDKKQCFVDFFVVPSEDDEMEL